MKSNKKTTIVGCIYRPNTPPKACMDTFTTKLIDIINKSNSEGKRLLMMGDFNIDLEIPYTCQDK